MAARGGKKSAAPPPPGTECPTMVIGRGCGRDARVT